jgi:5'-3' exoribonuclease 1
VVAGTKTGAGAPGGFATLRTLAVRGELRLAGVTVLGQPSKKESMIVCTKSAQAWR